MRAGRFPSKFLPRRKVSATMNVITESCSIGEVEISIETGKLAKQANSVVIRSGETAILVTAVSSREPKDLPFLPLTVEYRESNAAAGKIPGGYFKREGRLTDQETLTCRFIDRPIRPLFPKSYRNDTQIIGTLLSHDKIHEPDVLAITGASAALMISDAPWAGPVAGVRVARVQGKFVAFPSWEQMKVADILLVVAVSRDAIIMVEGGAEQALEADMIDALMFAKEAAAPLIAMQDRLRERAGKPKRVHVEPTVDTAFRESVMSAAEAELNQAFAIVGKFERRTAIEAVTKKVTERFLAEAPTRGAEIGAALSKLEKKIVRGRVLREGKRIDGRGTRDIRPIYIEAHPLPQAVVARIHAVRAATARPAAGRPETGRPATGMPTAGMPTAGMPDAGMPKTGMVGRVLEVMTARASIAQRARGVRAQSSATAGGRRRDRGFARLTGRGDGRPERCPRHWPWHRLWVPRAPGPGPWDRWLLLRAEHRRRCARAAAGRGAGRRGWWGW